MENGRQIYFYILQYVPGIVAFIQGVPGIVAFINNDIKELIFFLFFGFASLLKLVKFAKNLITSTCQTHAGTRSH
jgi:hypothetical protein